GGPGAGAGSGSGAGRGKDALPWPPQGHGQGPSALPSYFSGQFSSLPTISTFEESGRRVSWADNWGQRLSEVHEIEQGYRREDFAFPGHIGFSVEPCRRDMSKKEEKLLSADDHERIGSVPVASVVQGSQQPTRADGGSTSGESEGTVSDSENSVTGEPLAALDQLHEVVVQLPRDRHSLDTGDRDADIDARSDTSSVSNIGSRAAMPDSVADPEAISSPVLASQGAVAARSVCQRAADDRGRNMNSGEGEENGGDGGGAEAGADAGAGAGAGAKGAVVDGNGTTPHRHAMPSSALAVPAAAAVLALAPGVDPASVSAASRVSAKGSEGFPLSTKSEGRVSPPNTPPDSTPVLAALVSLSSSGPGAPPSPAVVVTVAAAPVT
ncbi:unnamed protein product, partial [Discosporangium mesarthrocarpum]